MQKTTVSLKHIVLKKILIARFNGCREGRHRRIDWFPVSLAFATIFSILIFPRYTEVESASATAQPKKDFFFFSWSQTPGRYNEEEE